MEFENIWYHHNDCGKCMGILKIWKILMMVIRDNCVSVSADASAMDSDSIRYHAAWEGKLSEFKTRSIGLRKWNVISSLLSFYVPICAVCRESIEESCIFQGPSGLWEFENIWYHHNHCGKCMGMLKICWHQGCWRVSLKNLSLNCFPAGDIKARWHPESTSVTIRKAQKLYQKFH